MSDKIIQFELVTPERVVFRQAVTALSVPTAAGEITILPGHIPLVSILRPGVLTAWQADGQERVMSVSGGFVEVLESKVVILADTAEMASELDETRIKAAKVKAEELKRQIVQQDDVAFTEAAVILEKELARLRAVNRWRRLKQ